MYILIYTWHEIPLFIKACLIISLLALAGIVAAILTIYIWRRKRKKKDKQLQELSARINDLLLPVVLPAAASGKLKAVNDISEFRSLKLSNKEVRRALVASMISYRNYFSAEIASRVKRLYKDLGLEKHAMRKLRQSNWEKRVYAMMELFKMDIAPDLSLVRSLTHDKHEYIRDYAWLLLIRFTKGDPLDVLREMHEPISQWETFEIFYLFQQKHNYKPGSMKGLIELNNEPSIVSLSLKLVVYFHDNDSVWLVIKLLKTENLALREQAVDVLGRLGLKSSADHLVHIYPSQPHEIQLAILSALGRIRNDSHLGFLEDAFLGSTDFDIKKHASDAIIKLYPLSKRSIDKLLGNNGTDELEQRILQHSLNPLINAV